MQSLTDAQLLAEYAARRSEPAFTTLVERYVALVHSAARRQVDDAQLAREITQAVFIILARKAGSLETGTVLAGWLCRTAHYAARDARKMERRRRQYEHSAAMNQDSTTDSARHDETAAWQQLAPWLDEAVAGLHATDRDAIVLRFYEKRSLEEVGASLGVSPDAAQKRVARALEKLRRCFAKRGVTFPAAVIAGAIAANSLQAAPVGFVASVIAAATSSTAAAVATASLAHRTLMALAWAKYKTLVGYAAAALVAGTAIIVGLPKRSVPPPMASSQQTNTMATDSEPLTDKMRFALETPPGALAVQADGKIIVGSTLFGRFMDESSGSLGFFTRGAFRLNPDGTLDRTFFCDVKPPGSAAQMAHLDVLPDNRIFISGLFGSLNGKARPNYAMLLPDGSVDESFEPWRGNTNQPPPFFLPNISTPTIWTLTAYQGGAMPATRLPDNSILTVCQSIENVSNPYLNLYPTLTAYRLDPSGRWIQPKSNYLSSEIVRPSGLIATLGPVGFSARTAIDWTRDLPAARNPSFAPGKSPFFRPNNRPVGGLPFELWIEPPSAADAAPVLQALFEETPVELCRYAVKLPDEGVILAIRDKENTGMTAPGHFMRFDKNWRPDFSFKNEYEANLRSCPSIKRLKDGKLLVAGLIGKMNGEDFPGLVRLEANGQIDHAFHCVTANDMSGRVMDMVVQPDGHIVICGFFSTVNGVEVPHLARLNPDGSLDQTFRTSFMTLDDFYADYRKNRRRVAVTQLAEMAGKSSAGVPIAPPQTILITSMRWEAGVAVIEFTGAPRQEYLLQAKDSLSHGGWLTIGTKQAAVDGTGTFRDAGANQVPTRFYRIASP